MKNKRIHIKVLSAIAVLVLCLGGFAMQAAAATQLTTAQKNFIEKIGPLATADMKKSGVLASLTMAQAILESGWGTSDLAKNANAIFGIKADSRWNGPTYSKIVGEYKNGSYVQEPAKFRSYSSWEHSINDHSAFLNASSRYAAVINEKDYRKACQAIHKAGYATDPGYADKLINLIETYNLTAYDYVGVGSSVPTCPLLAAIKARLQENTSCPVLKMVLSAF